MLFAKVRGYLVTSPIASYQGDCDPFLVAAHALSIVILLSHFNRGACTCASIFQARAGTPTPALTHLLSKSCICVAFCFSRAQESFSCDNQLMVRAFTHDYNSPAAPTLATTSRGEKVSWESRESPRVQINFNSFMSAGKPRVQCVSHPLLTFS